MRYRATVWHERTLQFEFDDTDIEDDDTPESAAMELSLTFPADAWNDDEPSVEVEELG